MRLAQRSLANKSGQAGVGITGGALLVVVGAAMLFIGMFINSEIKSSIPAATRNTWTAGENSSFTSAETSADTAFTLLGVGMIVAGAAIIIGILRSGF